MVGAYSMYNNIQDMYYSICNNIHDDIIILQHMQQYVIFRIHLVRTRMM